MIESEFIFLSKDGMKIHVHKWMPSKKEKLKGIIQLVHGSLEHSYRYRHFAQFLTSQGFGVYADDHRGHGKTADLNGQLFVFSNSEDGWKLAIDDQLKINAIIREENAELPIYMFGHSMGSFIVRTFAASHGDKINGAIIAGTGGREGTIPHEQLQDLLLLLDKLVKIGKTYETPLFHDLIYGTLNKAIENPVTSADFISRSNIEVQKYLKDPYCNQTITIDYAYELLKGITSSNELTLINRTPASLPLLLISGESDPVGGRKGEGILSLKEDYKQAGVKSVTVKIYEGARHELVNEVNREEVFDDILQWLLIQNSHFFKEEYRDN